MPEMSMPAVMILLLGAVHGINPAMGWLFAVSLGLQEGRGSATWRALGPLALGHALAIAATLLAAALIGLVVPIELLRWIAATALLAFGVRSLIRHRHPRLAGMKVCARDLTVWSFLMASAHGAGLMVLPFVLRLVEVDAHHGVAYAGHVMGAAAAEGAAAPVIAGCTHAAALGGDPALLLATVLHTAGYLLVAGAVAWLVYSRLGVRVLRSAWININLVWAIALIVTALFTPLL